MFKALKKTIPKVNAAQIGFYDSASIGDWVNKFPSAVCWVYEQRDVLAGGFQTGGFQTPSDWAGNPDIARASSPPVPCT